MLIFLHKFAMLCSMSSNTVALIRPDRTYLSVSLNACQFLIVQSSLLFACREDDYAKEDEKPEDDENVEQRTGVDVRDCSLVCSGSGSAGNSAPFAPIAIAAFFCMQIVANECSKRNRTRTRSYIGPHGRTTCAGLSAAQTHAQRL